MDSNYLRQQTLDLAIPQSAWVVGCGGVGYWVAYQLALAGVPELVLFDPDTVSSSNFNRIPYKPEDLDRNKAAVLAEHILAVRPSIVALAMGVSFTPELVAGSKETPAWLVATTDTWKSRQMCYRWAKGNGVRYLEAAAEGEIGSISRSPAEFATPEEDHPGYASVPVWCGPCLGAGLLASAHIIHGTLLDREVARIGWNGSDLDLFRK